MYRASEVDEVLVLKLLRQLKEIGPEGKPVALYVNMENAPLHRFLLQYLTGLLQKVYRYHHNDRSNKNQQSQTEYVFVNSLATLTKYDPELLEKSSKHQMNRQL